MIKPFGDFYLIRLASASGEGRVSLAFGTVVAVGDDMATFGTNGVGDTYYFRNGLPVKDPVTGEDFVLVHYDDIVAYIEAAEDDGELDEADVSPSFGGFTDWIPWSGGECPVDGDVEVMVVFRCEAVDGNYLDSADPAGVYYWSVIDGDNPQRDDIVYYRIV